MSSAPRYCPELMYSLARVLAVAALDELMTEMAGAQSLPSEPTKTNAATPRPRKARRSKDFDDADNTTVSENR
jgi:hypothetical protein